MHGITITRIIDNGSKWDGKWEEKCTKNENEKVSKEKENLEGDKDYDGEYEGL